MTAITDRTGGPAFPVADSHHANGQIQYGSNGMTLRDYFAAHAPKEMYDLEGWAACDCEEVLGLPEGVAYNWRKHYIPLLAKRSYEYADAMLKARKL